MASSKSGFGVAGYASGIIWEDGKKEVITGTRHDIGINQMYLIAVIETILYINRDSIRIYTDSEYVTKGVKRWLRQWKENGWLSYSSTTETANQVREVQFRDLWEEVDALRTNMKVTFSLLPEDNKTIQRASNRAYQEAYRIFFGQ